MLLLAALQPAGVVAMQAGAIARTLLPFPPAGCSMCTSAHGARGYSQHAFDPSLQACALSGCTAGTAAVQVAGAELGPQQLQQLRSSIGSNLQAAAIGAEPGGAAVASAAAPSC